MPIAASRAWCHLFLFLSFSLLSYSSRQLLHSPKPQIWAITSKKVFLIPKFNTMVYFSSYTYHHPLFFLPCCNQPWMHTFHISTCIFASASPQTPNVLFVVFRVGWDKWGEGCMYHSFPGPLSFYFLQNSGQISTFGAQPLKTWPIGMFVPKLILFEQMSHLLDMQWAQVCLHFILRAEETDKENMTPALLGLPI